MLSTLQTPNPLVFETRARGFPRRSLQTPAAAPWEPRGAQGWQQAGRWECRQRSGPASGAGSSHLLAAIPSRDSSPIICLLTINKAVGCRELLRNHNAV